MIERFSLNSYWKFALDKEDKGKEKEWYNSIPDNAGDIYVPACWNECDDEWYHYEGLAWYFKKFMFKSNPEVKRNVLFFYGVNYSCEVWLNGQFAGSHVGGFTPFEIDVTDLLSNNAENFIAVRVDNTMTRMTVPPIGVDWFNFGGIFRDVYILGTGESWLEDVFVATKVSGEIEVRLTTGSYSDKSDIKARLIVVDKNVLSPIADLECSIKAENDVLSFKINNPKLWSPESPFLYDFKLILSKDDRIVDVWEHKIGVREFSIKDRKILLNEKPIMLRGYSKHDEYPLLGRTFSKDLVRKDYEICKKGNANFLRLCHYPHHPDEYELASEFGFIVMAEIPNVNFTKDMFDSAEVLKNSVNQTKETLKYYKNEACIMFWSLFIECKTNEPSATEFIPGYIKMIKETDPTRFTIHASLIPLDDPAAAYFDIVGINYWSGWYYGETIEEGSEYLDKIAAIYPDKPVIMTSGGWEGIYGFHSHNRHEKWSEEEQVRYLEDVSRMYMTKDYCVGEIIWTFNDFRVSPWCISKTGRWTQRPMELNHKGVTDYFRRPKLSYFAMQRVFKEWDNKL